MRRKERMHVPAQQQAKPTGKQRASPAAPSASDSASKANAQAHADKAAVRAEPPQAVAARMASRLIPGAGAF